MSSAPPQPAPVPPPSAPQLAARTATIFIGSSLLVTFSGILLVGTAVVGITQQPAASILPILWTLAWAAEVFKEYRTVLKGDRVKQTFDAKADGLNFVAVVVAALVTFWISTTLGKGPIVASAVIGALGAAVMKPNSPAIHLGSFVGMASAPLFSYWLILAASAIAGATFVASKHAFNGFGGKLGTCAWTGCIIASQIAGKTLLTGNIAPWSTGWLLILYSGVGASLTHLLNHHFKQGPVMASSIVGLLGWAILPKLHPSYPSLDLGVYTASFVGMSAPNRCPKWYHALPSGLLCGYFIMYFPPFMQGGGGKLGTTALASVIGFKTLLDLTQSLLLKVQHKPENPAVEVKVSDGIKV